MSYIVQIRRYSDESLVKEFGPYGSEKMAERADSGVNHNLHHEYYYTIIIEKPPESDETEGFRD